MLARLNTMQSNDYDQGLNHSIPPGQSSSPHNHGSSTQSQSSSLDMPYQVPIQAPQTLHTLPPYNPLYAQSVQGSQNSGQVPTSQQQQWAPQWSSYSQPYSRVSFSGPATSNPQSQYRFDSYDDHSSSPSSSIPLGHNHSHGSQSSMMSGSSASATSSSSSSVGGGPTLPKSPMDNYNYSNQRSSVGHPSSQSTVYSFVPLPGAQQQKRARRKYEDIERIYNCNYPNCTKAYGTLNHLNAHITMQGHGEKRTPAEFKETRRLWKLKKKEQEISHQSQQ